MTTGSPPPAWNTSFDITSGMDGAQDPVVTALSNGTFVVIWQAFEADPEAGTNKGTLWVRVFNADGSPRTAGNEIILHAGDAGKYEPSVTALNNGNFVVAWEDDSGLDGDTQAGIRGQIFGSEGQKIGADFHINSQTAGYQGEVSIAALANGGFAVSYTDGFNATIPGADGDGGSTGVRTRVFDSAGHPVLRAEEDPEAFEDMIANTIRSGGQTNSTLITLKDGRYVVIFEDGSHSSDDPKQTIRGHFFKADGTPDDDKDFLIPTSAGNKSWPSAASLANGNFVVVWQSDATGDYTVKAQIFDPSGKQVGPELEMNQGEGALQEWPLVTALKDGGFAISYTSIDDPNTGHIAVFKGTGEFVANFALDVPPGFSMDDTPSLTTLADGRLLASWSLNEIETGASSVHAQIFDPRTSPVHLTGTGASEQYVGTVWADVLDGGAGADVLKGGAGNDVYYVDNASDVVVEALAADGIDTVVASVSYTLSAFVENLVASGTSAINLTGNELNNVITGNAASNVINGGAGADIMDGGAGDDTYVVDNAGDVVRDASGTDTVVTGIDYVLGADIETLVASGSAWLRLTGNAAKNTVIGNDGNNKINGGSGNDVLTGGAGSDVFMFTTRLGTSKTDRLVNFDTIADFKMKQDKIWLDNAVFKKLGKGTELKPGKLNAKFFVIGDKAKDKDDYLIYNKKTGILSYDADGSGKGAAVEFAKLAKNLKLTDKDFLII